MKEIKIDELNDVPYNFTGIVKIESGTKKWYLHGKRHRKDGPAVERFNGDKYWYLNGKLHREDGPAVERSNGTKKWYLHGKRHRKDGPAVECVNGDKHWYQNGKCHRLDGPATIWNNGTRKWRQNGMLHRLDGPAVETNNTENIKEYWINNQNYCKKDFDQITSLVQQQLSKRNTEYKHLTDEQWYSYLNIFSF